MKAEPGKVCIVSELPGCDFCGAKPDKIFDAGTAHGPWAFMCEACWREHGRNPGQLGVGIGQIWIKEEE